MYDSFPQLESRLTMYFDITIKTDGKSYEYGIEADTYEEAEIIAKRDLKIRNQK
jgi:hypothetical protein